MQNSAKCLFFPFIGIGAVRGSKMVKNSKFSKQIFLKLFPPQFSTFEHGKLFLTYRSNGGGIKLEKWARKNSISEKLDFI